VIKELNSLKNLQGTITGEDLFIIVCRIMKELRSALNKTKGGENRWGSKYDWKENRFDGYS
jgi:hypothetical protein